jgi:hypothetical protein
MLKKKNSNINSSGRGSVESKNEFLGMECGKIVKDKMIRDSIYKRHESTGLKEEDALPNPEMNCSEDPYDERSERKTLAKPVFMRSSNNPLYSQFHCEKAITKENNSFSENPSTVLAEDLSNPAVVISPCKKITDIDFFEKSSDDLFETDDTEFSDFNEEYFLFLEKIRDEIEKMDKIHHIKILKILKNHKNIKLNENKSGVFINLSFLPKCVVNKIMKYVEYIREQEKYILTVENQQENLKSLLSGNNPIRSCENIHSQTI